jgi:hypothetical protein
VGAWIAYQQVRIAKAKLKFDLYSKRYAVFEAARNLWIEVVQHDHVDTPAIKDFLAKTSEAVFCLKGTP